MQEFRTPYDMTERAIATSLRTGPAWSYESAKAADEHKLEMERSLLFGERKVAYSSGNARYTTRGLRPFIASGNVFNVNGVLAEFDFDDWIRAMFVNGTGTEVSTTKILLANDRLLTVISRFAKARLQTFQEDKAYGVSIQTYRTPVGTVKLIHHRLFDQAFANVGYGMCYDPANVSTRFFAGDQFDGHTKLHPNIQANDATKRKDEYRTTMGLEVRHASTHGEIKNVSG